MKEESAVLKYLYRVVDGTEKGPLANVVLVLLTVLEGFYRCLLGLNRLLSHPRRLPVPVISIGNLVAGGTGKTPTVAWLVRQLQAAGRTPAILTRGYNGTAQKEGIVFNSNDLSNLDPQLTGDEPYLLAGMLPGTWVAVGRDRFGMGQAALRKDPAIDCFVLDDGFQYWNLKRDYDIVVMDAGNPFGNGRLIPRGTMREPLSALKRAQAVFLTRIDRTSPPELERLTARLNLQNPELSISLVETVPPGLVALGGHGNEKRIFPAAAFLKGRSCGAVTAIGNPEQFFDSLRQLGVTLIFQESYPDHYSWDAADIQTLISKIQKSAIREIITTAKDGVKLEQYTELFKQAGIEVLILTLEFRIIDSGQAVLRQIHARIHSKG